MFPHVDLGAHWTHAQLVAVDPHTRARRCAIDEQPRWLSPIGERMQQLGAQPHELGRQHVEQFLLPANTARGQDLGEQLTIVDVVSDELDQIVAILPVNPHQQHGRDRSSSRGLEQTVDLLAGLDAQLERLSLAGLERAHQGLLDLGAKVVGDVAGVGHRTQRAGTLRSLERARKQADGDEHDRTDRPREQRHERHFTHILDRARRMNSADDSASVTRLDDGSGWQVTNASTRLTPGDLIPGTRLRIQGWLGEGGMGQVYEALHLDLGRRVAVKVMRRVDDDDADDRPRLAAAFTAEARACARIESRSVVEVLDLGELPDHRPYYVMELLEPTTIHHALELGWMKLERALPILRQCCKALAAVHAAGLVHRDIKTRNVVLQTEDGRGDTVRLVDFGLAAPIGSCPRVSGTARGMAPEQILGERLDGRLDIYALGCMAYEMLSGRTPFTGTAVDVLEAHLHDAPPPLTRLRPDLPASVDPVLLRCLAKRPEARWADVHEFEAALIELQIELGVVTPWDDLPMPLVDETRRQRLLAAMPRIERRRPWRVFAGLAAMLVVGTVAGVLVAGGREQPATDVPTVAHEPELARIDELTNEVRLAASKACWVHPNPDEPEQRTALQWIAVLEAQQGPLTEQARERAELLRNEIAATLTRLGDRYWAAEHGQSFALEFYALALTFVPDLQLPDERVPLTPVQLASVITRSERGQFSPAELALARVLAALADDDPERRRRRTDALLDGESGLLSLRLTEQLAKLVAAEPTAAIEPSPGTEPSAAPDDTQLGGEANRRPAEAAKLVEQGHAAAARGDRRGARAAFTSALELDNRSTAALVGLAELNFEAGHYAKALGHARKAARLRPDDAELQLLLGDCYLKSLRRAEARAAYARAEQLGDARATTRLAKLE